MHVQPRLRLHAHRLCAGSWGRGARAAAGVREDMQHGRLSVLTAQQVSLRQHDTGLKPIACHAAYVRF